MGEVLVAMANSTSGKPQYDYLIKLLLIGDSGVGKSCLPCRYSEDIFNNKFITTIGIDFKIRTIELDGKKIKLQVWDTAGQERFRTITQSYYKNAMGIIVVYDITDERSFNGVRSWMRNIEEHAYPDLPTLLLGNKCDLKQKRAVKHEEGENLAKEYGSEFFEVSAKDKINVDQAFTRMAKLIKDKRKDEADPHSNKESHNIDLNNNVQKKKSGGCC